MTIGNVICIAGNPIIWKSKIQTTASTLICEVEYAAIFEAIKDSAWLRSFEEELGYMPPGSTTIPEDNTGAIKWVNCERITSGRRQIRVEYHYSVEEVRGENVEL